MIARGAGIAELGAALAAGRLTSRLLVQSCLDRIAALQPYFGAVRCLSPDALDQAELCDAARSNGGRRGRLEGLPVLIKDNIDVAGLPTTGGSLALEHSYPVADAEVVAGLRAAGAVILGKTNLTELANFMTEGMPSGYSALGGQVLNPYDTTWTPSGSSSGSAAAVALNLCVVAVGSETDGSITSPAAHQSVVGVKPTMGLISQHGILPIAASQDTAGPLARTVADAAALLEGMAGVSFGPLDASALRGARLGVVAGTEPSRRHREAIAAMESAGATVVEVTMPELEEERELTVLVHEFGRDVAAYLAALPADAPIRSLIQLRDWNLAHADEALKFGQTHVDSAIAVDHDGSRKAYEQIRQTDLAYCTAQLERALSGGQECLVFPDDTGCSWAARAGWPSICVPAGYGEKDRRPVGIMLVTRPHTDARLLSLAFSYEQATLLRRSPWSVNPAAFRQVRL